MAVPQHSQQPVKPRPLPAVIFMTRWLQLPLYLGLILAQCIHALFLLSALAIAYNDRIMVGTQNASKPH